MKTVIFLFALFCFWIVLFAGMFKAFVVSALALLCLVLCSIVLLNNEQCSIRKQATMRQ